MRLSAYDVEKTTFKTLFKEKIMAGLAGYVENGQLSEAGINRACEGLLEFKSTLNTLELERVSVRHSILAKCVQYRPGGAPSVGCNGTSGGGSLR